MLSPEIWHFKPPEHSFEVIHSSESNKAVSEIRKHYFNHTAVVVLPNTVLLPEDFNSSLIQDSVYYKVNQLSINRFLEKDFISSFLRSGSLTALSEGTHIDTDDCAAITPSGHLVLNLLKETYQSLGLEGTQSKFSSERYVIKIDLRDPSFSPGKKNYERAVRCLTEFVNLQMDFLIAWEPPDSTVDGQLICPSSIAAHLSQLGYTVVSCAPRAVSCRQYSARLPNFATTDHCELLEWLGAVVLGVDMNREDPEGRYLSTYSGPANATDESQVAVLKHFGFFTTVQIENMFKVLRLYTKKRADLPWAVLHIQGFADSPVSWGLREHAFHSGGDNHYTLVLQPDNFLQLYKTSTFLKKMKLSNV